MHWLERHWYRRSPVSAALVPLATLYCVLMALRRFAYRVKLFKSVRVAVPVVVVGNISVGGTGKTPLVAWLAQLLRANGYRPGVVTRGYGGQSNTWPRDVMPDSDPAQVGDEPVLLARAGGCPVVADPERTRAARRLIEHHGCNLIVSDDGLQHYRLQRDIEIAVIDGERRFGNGWCLPAGPLREPVSRLRSVDARVTQGIPAPGEWGMTLVAEHVMPLGGGAAVALEHLRGRRLHAVAGIGNPIRFFQHLHRLGLEFDQHAFPDHHRYSASDLAFGAGTDVIMTEKDAVKCERLGVPGWYLKVAAQPDARLGELVLRRLKEIAGG